MFLFNKIKSLYTFYCFQIYNKFLKLKIYYAGLSPNDALKK